MRPEEADPKGLIAQSFKIEGIGASECRAIFLDWALSLPDGTSPDRALKRLIARHQGQPRDHPMQQVMRDGLDAPAKPARRGGWQGRRRDP